MGGKKKKKPPTNRQNNTNNKPKKKVVAQEKQIPVEDASLSQDDIDIFFPFVESSTTYQDE